MARSGRGQLQEGLGRLTRGEQREDEDEVEDRRRGQDRDQQPSQIAGGSKRRNVGASGTKNGDPDRGLGDRGDRCGQRCQRSSEANQEHPIEGRSNDNAIGPQIGAGQPAP